MLKTYACSPISSKGRIYKEQTTPYRNDFERDRDRIVHSNAFKRLQYKTQVFVNHEGDMYRNRLTHSLEVSMIARSVSKSLGICEDLAEAVALAHDLGHTPFGHAGEEALSECMAGYGGFSHNAHSFKLLTFIEQRYASYNGLNLSWEVLEGIVKHNGPVTHQDSAYDYVFAYDREVGLELDKYSSAEAQVAAMCDDIAYICHDLEDSTRAGLLTYKDIAEIEFIDQYMSKVRKEFPYIDDNHIIYETTRKVMHHFIEDLLLQTKNNIKEYKIKTEQDIRQLGRPLVEFSAEKFAEIKSIKSFLMGKVYRHPNLFTVMNQCMRLVKDLFELYTNNIELLPLNWQEEMMHKERQEQISIIADYIAGMTDRFALKQHQKFFNLNFNS